MRQALLPRSRDRRHLGVRTWVALAVFLWGTALPVLETHEVADPDQAGYQFLVSSGGALRIDTPPADGDRPAHCIYCHWQRAVSGAMVSEAARVASPDATRSSGRLFVSRLTALPFSSHASRAPPLS